jgi:hypothetical protein
MMKAVAARQKGAQCATKDGVPKIKTRLKRPTSVEPSLAQIAKQAKVVKASSFAPTSTRKVATPSPPTDISNDVRVVPRLIEFHLGTCNLDET